MNIEKMRKAANIVSNILDSLEDFIKVGITGRDINDFCVNELKKYGATAGTLGYRGFPSSLCVSINEIVCHGIPNNKYKLKNGDLIKCDIVAVYDGHYGDSCRTYLLGENIKHRRIMNAAYESMWKTIELIKDGINVQVLGESMESVAKSFGYNTIRDFTGHGIGTVMHKEPSIPFYKSKYNYSLKEGECITIEPMVTCGKYDLKILSDEWSAIMIDGSPTAQFEHTILVTKNGYEVLTYSEYDKKNNKIQSSL